MFMIRVLIESRVFWTCRLQMFNLKVYRTTFLIFTPAKLEYQLLWELTLGLLWVAKCWAFIGAYRWGCNVLKIFIDMFAEQKRREHKTWHLTSKGPLCRLTVFWEAAFYGNWYFDVYAVWVSELVTQHKPHALWKWVDHYLANL